uniref:Cytochrome b n=1 Tax=Polydora cf. ciliata DS-2023 TaxID=3033393 RepID=A0AA95EJF6_9ANNE|nr:cytochrome b [Polydora cf. ciliata DS-2023]
MWMRNPNHSLKKLNKALADLPAPPNLSAWWNFGSLLGLALTVQILTGLMLAIHYSPHTDLAFESVAHIGRDVNNGWLVRGTHANGASWFFGALYIHVARGIYYGSFMMKYVWFSGITMMLMVMGTAFLGYVLPWGQMSFWGATVITNMLSAIPYFGESLLKWIWGGFAVGNPTLQRFYVFHFCLPFALAGMVGLHIYLLHETGSNNPLGLKSGSEMVPFHPLYTSKDIVGVIIFMGSLMAITCFFPTLLSDPANFLPANPLVTPTHIQPEWYFLWAYAILRSIPNKLGGVIAMFAAILILFTLPYTHPKTRRGFSFFPMNQILFWMLLTDCILLTWIGGRPVEDPYIFLGQMFTVFYFSFFIINPLIMHLWNSFLSLGKTLPKI